MIRGITYLVWDVGGEMVYTMKGEGSVSAYKEISVGRGSWENRNCKVS